MRGRCASRFRQAIASLFAGRPMQTPGSPPYKGGNRQRARDRWRVKICAEMINYGKTSTNLSDSVVCPGEQVWHKQIRNLLRDGRTRRPWERVRNCAQMIKYGGNSRKLRRSAGWRREQVWREPMDLGWLTRPLPVPPYEGRETVAASNSEIFAQMIKYGRNSRNLRYAAGWGREQVRREPMDTGCTTNPSWPPLCGRGEGSARMLSTQYRVLGTEPPRQLGCSAG